MDNYKWGENIKKVDSATAKLRNKVERAFFGDLKKDGFRRNRFTSARLRGRVYCE
jgi:hypothetical protein